MTNRIPFRAECNDNDEKHWLFHCQRTGPKRSIEITNRLIVTDLPTYFTIYLALRAK